MIKERGAQRRFLQRNATLVVPQADTVPLTIVSLILQEKGQARARFGFDTVGACRLLRQAFFLPFILASTFAAADDKVAVDSSKTTPDDMPSCFCPVYLRTIWAWFRSHGCSA